MKVILVIGRTGTGKTTLAGNLSEKPALFIPYDREIPDNSHLKKYRSLIIDDAGLRDAKDWERISEIVHYGRRFINEIWIIAHYFTQIPADIRTAATQLWIGRMDRNLMPSTYKLEIPDCDFVFYGYGDDPRKIRLKIKT